MSRPPAMRARARVEVSEASKPSAFSAGRVASSAPTPIAIRPAAIPSTAARASGSGLRERAKRIPRA